MNSGRKIKNNIYLIEWQDAHANSGWFSEEELNKFIKEQKCIIREVGWILSETKDEIVMSSRRIKEAEKNNFDEWGMLQKIPKTWIKKRIILKNV